METSKQLNPGSWADCYSEYLLAFAMNRLKDKQMAEDMVQETFLKGLSKLALFKGNSSELTWLTAILKNNIYDLLRKNAKQERLEDFDFADDVEDEYFEKNGAWKEQSKPGFWHYEKMDALERKELFQAFEKCLGHLPLQWASVFTMKHLDNEESENICKELNISSSNLWTIMHRAKLKLRFCIEKRWLNQ
ncbi:MAG TPA: sigma-70 family RNA polymerase sigma factor [Mucilaginibacter sp.]